MDRPIGYWVKHLDNLLENAMGQALATHGASRREWQLLHATAQGENAAVLAPFEGVEEAVQSLTSRGWLADGRLTGEGRAVHTAVSERVTRFRQQVTQGVSPQEYRTAVEVLRRMAANAER
ncbi:MarR family transcriptional regulator [Nonomuraea sp. NPDC049758]|uniref:MarR family winged helix-turn-helix transcriptional regulator n=1 Tax=Nonomuraea sp. NPDC049758 TaxID=3154360 RepID=UPI0034167EF2